ncbi:unnamed protein product, partial [Ectocarpus fasciculatus]
VATTTDEDGFADDGSEGGVVLGDDPEVEAGDDLSASGGVSTAGVGTLGDGQDGVEDSGSHDGAVDVVAEGGEVSALSFGDGEASGVPMTEGDAGVDEGETRPRRSWLPWRRHQPADVDEDPVTNLEPAGDDAAVADPNLSEDAVDVDDGLTGGVLEQAALSLAESVLLASESITNGGEDVSTGEAGDVSDGDDRGAGDAITGDIGPSSHGATRVMLQEGGGASAMTDSPGQDGVLSEEISHMEE